MTSSASVEGRDSVRLFCALRPPDDVLDALETWQRDRLPDRVVPRSNLHVTLAFLGRRTVADVEPVLEQLRAAAADAGPIRLEPVRYRETRSVGMLVLDDHDDAATRLAEDLHDRLSRIGVYEPEPRPWLPHLTVLRFRERPLLSPPVPPLGRFSPSDAAAYHSVLRSAGAQYEVIESFALGG